MAHTLCDSSQWPAQTANANEKAHMRTCIYKLYENTIE